MKLQKQILTGTVLLALSSLATAEVYVGGAFGSTSVEVSGYDNSDTFKIYGGYRQNNFGIEGGYVNFDRFDVEGTGGTQNITGDGLEVSAIGFLPIGQQLELFGKLGVLAWNLDANSSGNTFGTDDGTSFAYGVGLQIKPAQQFSLRLEYQGFQDVSGSDLSSLMLGGAYHF